MEGDSKLETLIHNDHIQGTREGDVSHRDTPTVGGQYLYDKWVWLV